PINNEAHAVVADDFLRGGGHHPHVAVGDNRRRTVLRERPLIKPFRHRRRISPVVFLPVVFRNGGGGVLRQAKRESGGGSGFNKIAAVHHGSCTGRVLPMPKPM